MPSDVRSISFIFHRNESKGNSNSRNWPRRCRLQDRFESEQQQQMSPSCSSSSKKRSKSSENKQRNNVALDSRKLMRNGAEKVTKTLSTVKVNFDNLSQKLKRSTRRCHRLEEQYTPKQPQQRRQQTPRSSHSSRRLLLGRTPTKMYSPFGIESPKEDKYTEMEVLPTQQQEQTMPKINRGRCYTSMPRRLFGLLKNKPSSYALK